jgi:hypothetical protein
MPLDQLLAMTRKKNDTPRVQGSKGIGIIEHGAHRIRKIAVHRGEGRCRNTKFQEPGTI